MYVGRHLREEEDEADPAADSGGVVGQHRLRC